MISPASRVSAASTRALSYGHPVYSIPASLLAFLVEGFFIIFRREIFQKFFAAFEFVLDLLNESPAHPNPEWLSSEDIWPFCTRDQDDAGVNVIRPAQCRARRV